MPRAVPGGGGAKARRLKKADAPFLDVPASDSEQGASGELAPVACKVLMKILYAARMARYDLLRATCFLATRITKWDAACDRQLHRLVCYINTSLELRSPVGSAMTHRSWSWCCTLTPTSPGIRQQWGAPLVSFSA